MLRFLKALSLALAFVALIIVATSCGSSSAKARFVNAIADSNDYHNEGLDIYFGSTKGFTNIAFGATSGSNYVSVPSGDQTVAAYLSGQPTTSTPVFTHPGVNLGSGSLYTLVATGSAAGTGSNVVILNPTDNDTAPQNGNINFRIINASPSGPTGGGSTPDIYLIPNPASGVLPSCTTANGCVQALAYQSTSPYITLPINTEGNGWQLVVTPTGGQQQFSTTINGFGSSAEGAICTIVLTDQQNGSIMSSNPILLNDLNGCTN
ncbi:MAG TPA: DUF4397 domain-containing protein [Terriglobales bacterium]|nr:DUF4397 domain-containing protein [Terriglobales bacterium]